MAVTNDYFSKLAQVESANKPYVKARTSSASGLFQFIKSTWEGLGYQWGNDNSKAFGGLKPSIETQLEAIKKFTLANAKELKKSNIPVNDQTLYAAHFLGAGTAKKVLSAPKNERLSNVLSPSVINANSFLRGKTVNDFNKWLENKMGPISAQNQNLSPEKIINDIAGAFLVGFGITQDKEAGATIAETITNSQNSAKEQAATKEAGASVQEGLTTVSNSLDSLEGGLRSFFGEGVLTRIFMIVLGGSVLLIVIMQLTQSQAQ